MAKLAHEEVSALARSLVQGLTEDETRDLSTTRLADLEQEVYGLMDQLAGRMLQALLVRQAEQIEAVETCPACGKRLTAKAPQTKTLVLKRNQVHWRQPVSRCQHCRRDFFPSGDRLGL